VEYYEINVRNLKTRKKPALTGETHPLKENSEHLISNTHNTNNTESEVARDSETGSSAFPPRGHNEISTRIGYLPSLTPPPIQKRKDKIPERIYSFEIPPEPIPASDIKEEIEAEVVVVGAGIAGLSASISAAEAGAKTILVEKMATVQARGHDNAFLNSRLQKKLGIEIDKEEVILNLMK